MTAYVNHRTSVYDSMSDTEILLYEDWDRSKMISVRTSDNYHGKIDFSMTIEVAEAFAKAMLKQCELIRDRND